MQSYVGDLRCDIQIRISCDSGSTMETEVKDHAIGVLPVMVGSKNCRSISNSPDRHNGLTGHFIINALVVVWQSSPFWFLCSCFGPLMFAQPPPAPPVIPTGAATPISPWASPAVPVSPAMQFAPAAPVPLVPPGMAPGYPTPGPGMPIPREPLKDTYGNEVLDELQVEKKKAMLRNDNQNWRRPIVDGEYHPQVHDSHRLHSAHALTCVSEAEVRNPRGRVVHSGGKKALGHWTRVATSHINIRCIPYQTFARAEGAWMVHATGILWGRRESY